MDRSADLVGPQWVCYLKSIFRSPGFWLGMLEHADWFTDGSLVELISKLPVFFVKKNRHIFDFRVLVCFLKWWWSFFRSSEIFFLMESHWFNGGVLQVEQSKKSVTTSPLRTAFTMTINIPLLYDVICHVVWTQYWLVVWNIFYFSHHFGNVIIPTDFHSIIFPRGRPTTNQRTIINHH